MRETYEVYYRHNGVRYPETLVDPKPFDFKQFSKSAVFHDVNMEHGPNLDPNRPYYQGYQNKCIVENIYTFYQPKGDFRSPKIAISDLVRPWRRQNVKTWTVDENSYVTQHGQEVLIVMNYGYLNTTYRWMPLKMTPYWRWYNYYRTVFTQANKIANASNRNQFIIIDVPTVIQGKTLLDKFSKTIPATQQLATMLGLGGIDAYMELEFWRWLDPISHANTETQNTEAKNTEAKKPVPVIRDNSILTLIEPKNYGRINFIFRGKAGRSTLINMAIWNSWIKGQEIAPNAFSKTQYGVIAIQKFFLKMLMSLNEIHVATEDGTLDGDQALANISLQDVTADTEVLTQQEPDEVLEFPKITAYSRTPFEDIEKDINELNDLEYGEVANYATSPNINSSNKDILKQQIDEISSSIGDKRIPEREASSILSGIEHDIDALDRLNLIQIRNSIAVESEKEQEDDPEERLRKLPTKESVQATFLTYHPPEALLTQQIEQDADSNLLTAAEYRKLKDAVEKYNNSEDPYGSNQPRKIARVVHPEDRAITKEDTELVVGNEVVDKTMANSTITAFNRKYLRKVYTKNMLEMVDAVQSAGIVIKEHEVRTETSILGTYERHRIELKPIDGQSSVVQFTLPKISEDGTYVASNNKYLLRTQRVDLPIRKIAPSVVALSSYYGKTFIQVNPKVANNNTAYVIRKINLAMLTEDSFISSISLGDVFDNNFKAPFIYNALANHFESFKTANGNHFFLNHRTRSMFIPEERLKVIEVKRKDGEGYDAVCVGLTAKGEPIVVDKLNHFFVYRQNGVEDLGDIFDVLQIAREKAPVNFSEVRVFSKYIPVGIAMGYYIGLRSLLSLLDIDFRVVHARKNKQLIPGEFAINFKDVSLIFKDKGDTASMVIAGFQDYDKVTKLYEVSQFDHRDVYLNLLMSKKIGAIYIRELDMMEHCFVDPITRQILETMKEPLTFKQLLIRASELLTTYHHPSSQDRKAMRDRGYERFSGAVYTELMRAIRGFKNRNMFGRGKVDISPYEVWNAIMKDNSGKIAEDINPIQNLKESEVITFSGTGGRGKDSMTKPTRAFHRNDFGVLSESTVDSTSVGAIAYLSANPNIGDVYGLMKEEKEINPTSVLSTSAILAPTVLTDNPKRIMFVNTQNSHTIASPAYKQGYLLTGYETVIGQRTSKLFSTVAEEDGVVVSVTPEGIVVKYASGRIDGIELGLLYGRAEGTTYPHQLKTTLSTGDKFKRGETLAYNTNFFEPSYNDPDKITFKMSRCVNVAYMEKQNTHEDSSAISQAISDLFRTEVIKVKSFVVEFKQNVYTTLKSGDDLLPSDVLLIIEDAITSSHDQFSSTSLETLKRLGNLAPTANVIGRVDKIEVFYHGEKQDMTMTLKKLADQSDQYLSRLKKASNQTVVSGKVTDEYRVSGKPLQPDHAEVRIYISVPASTGVGDKVIFGHQMKSTIAEVIPGEMITEDGQTVDAIFSYRSAAARGVHSPLIMGTTITLLDVLAKRAIDAYGE